MKIVISHNLSHLGFKKYQIYKNGNIENIKTKKILKKNKNRNGYYTIRINNDSNIKKTLKIHRLLGLCFIKNNNIKEKTEIDHIDRNKQNNKLSNLRWITHQQNCLNKNKYRNTKNYYRNIYYDEKRNNYRVQIRRKGKFILNQRVESLEEAIEVRDEYLEEL